jgi:ubiquitin C-terminal hydrolase
MAQEVDMTIMTKPSTDKESRAVQALTVWKREFSNLYSPMVDLFYGLMHVRVECQTCKNTTHRWETFTTLKAVVPTTEAPSLASMLAEELKPEMIDGYDCENCKAKAVAKKSLAIWRMPQTMVVVLKRFSYTGQKIQTKIAPIGPTDFGAYFSDESPEKSKTYGLQAIVDHHGSSAGGHYTAQCRHTETDTWFLYDDEGVRELPEPFFGNSTYMLFFRRI